MILNIFLRTEASSLSCFSLCCIFFSPIFFCCDFIICMLVLLVSFSHILFFFASLPLARLHPLSLRGNFWSVRTPWYSGSGIRVHLLLHDLPKNPSLSAAWYVLCLKVLCRCSRILSLVFLELSTCVSAHRFRMPHITLWRDLSASPFGCPLPLVFGTFLWWCVLTRVILSCWQVKLIIRNPNQWDWGQGGWSRFSKLFFF